MFSNNKENQKGVALYISLMVLALILGVALGINALIQHQVRQVRDVGSSLFALGAADAGIEKVFYDSQRGINVLAQCPETGQPDPSLCQGMLANGASYQITVVAPGVSGCPASVPTYCAKSLGAYSASRRALRIAR